MRPEIIIEIEGVFGSLTMESYPSYCPFGLSQGTFQTNKHNHFKQKEAESPQSLNENKTLGFCHNEDTLAHSWGPY